MNIEKTDPHRFGENLRELYLETSDERAPERLNRQVLRAATREAQASGSRIAGWTRPLAWAAMIGLTLGLLLDIAELPQPAPGDVPLDLEAKAIAEPGRQAGRVDDMAALPLLENARSGTRQTPHAADQQATVENAYRESAARPPTAAETAPSDPQRHGQEKAFMLEHRKVLSEPFAGAAIESRPDTANAPAPTCREEEKRSAAQWYACVEHLRESGRASAAETELEALLRVFPEFAR